MYYKSQGHDNGFCRIVSSTYINTIDLLDLPANTVNKSTAYTFNRFCGTLSTTCIRTLDLSTTQFYHKLNRN